MDTPPETTASSFVYHRIPTKVSRKDFNRYIEPHLHRPQKGPKPKLSLYKIFNYILYPTFKGSECPCRFLVLRTLHTMRRRDRAHHRPTGDKDGHQRAAGPRAPLSIIGPRLLVKTRPTPLRPLGLRSGLCCLGAAGHACAGRDGPVSGSRCRSASRAPSASPRPRSVRASPATRGRSLRDSCASESRARA